jgi:hypothetical protein
MRAQLRVCDDAAPWNEVDEEVDDEVDENVLRPFRVQAEMASIRADSARHLAKQVGRVERLLKEAPVESLSAYELLSLNELIFKLKQLTLP